MGTLMGLPVYEFDETFDRRGAFWRMRMAVVKTARKIGTLAGKVLDEEDRRALGGFVVIAVSVGLGIVGLAASFGLALRVFEAASG